MSEPGTPKGIGQSPLPSGISKEEENARKLKEILMGDPDCMEDFYELDINSSLDKVRGLSSREKMSEVEDFLVFPVTEVDKYEQQKVKFLDWLNQTYELLSSVENNKINEELKELYDHDLQNFTAVFFGTYENIKRCKDTNRVQFMEMAKGIVERWSFLGKCLEDVFLKLLYKDYIPEEYVEEVMVDSIIDKVVKVVRERIGVSKKLNFVVDNLDFSKIGVTCCEAAIVNSVMNIVANADKPKVGATEIGIKISLVGDEVVIFISNNGKKIDQSVMENMYQPGYSGTGGTGVGLAYMDKRFQSMGSKLSAESTDELTSFELRIPTTQLNLDL